MTVATRVSSSPTANRRTRISRENLLDFLRSDPRVEPKVADELIRTLGLRSPDA
jgi:hypothetical protein